MDSHAVGSAFRRWLGPVLCFIVSAALNLSGAQSQILVRMLLAVAAIWTIFAIVTHGRILTLARGKKLSVVLVVSVVMGLVWWFAAYRLFIPPAARVSTPAEIAAEIIRRLPAPKGNAAAPAPAPPQIAPARKTTAVTKMQSLLLANQSNKPPAPKAAASTKPETAQPQLTLRSLFEEKDFPTLFRARGDATIENDDGTTTALEVQVFRDFSSKAMFLGLFVPHCDTTHQADPTEAPCARKTYEICKEFADHYSDAFKLTGNASMGGFVGEPLTSAKDLTFTGRITLVQNRKSENRRPLTFRPGAGMK